MLDIYIFEPDSIHLKRLQEICIKYSIVHNTDSELYTYTNLPIEFKFSDQISLYMVKSCEQIGMFSDKIRLINADNYTVLIAESINDIMNSISALFRPSGILMKPAEYEPAEKILDDIYADYRRCSNKTGTQFRFKIRSREYSVNTDSILYFETANKKMILRTAGQAFEFYMPAGEVIEKLPDEFLRIHKSYIVNISHISVIDYKEMTVTLSDGSVIYVSRTYKEQLQQAFSERKIQK
ncbi:MAG: LytR/AlgR family response regulator transcription factor [Oscillospiraceae bacterium]